MNASYNILVQQYLPQATIVYDRYHMQAQFGKEVLGAVRLAEAREHRQEALLKKEQLSTVHTVQETQRIKKEIQAEQAQYRTLKRSRWPLLTNQTKLSASGKASLSQILQDHESLAICYSMKEEMIRLFKNRDPQTARSGWEKWFEAAKASEIEPLVRFAEQKEKRIEGLIAHAVYPISTGKLEGFNNKIKVSKRIGYGYRDDEYFFTLIRFISIPKSSLFHGKP